MGKLHNPDVRGYAPAGLGKTTLLSELLHRRDDLSWRPRDEGWELWKLHGGAQLMIGTGTLPRESLAGQVAVVTGAGRGVGFEAARALEA